MIRHGTLLFRVAQFSKYLPPLRLSCGKTNRNCTSKSCTVEEIPVIQVFSSPSCTLCDEVLFQLEQLRLTYHFKIETVNIKENQLWKRKYQYDIPVIHVNDQYLCKHSLDLELLHARLKLSRKWSFLRFMVYWCFSDLLTSFSRNHYI